MALLYDANVRLSLSLSLSLSPLVAAQQLNCTPSARRNACFHCATGHTGRVWTVAFNPTGTLLARYVSHANTRTLEHSNEPHVLVSSLFAAWHDHNVQLARSVERESAPVCVRERDRARERACAYE